MKQRKPIARKTPLRANKPMKRSTAAVPEKSSVNPTRAKRPTVTAEERAARKAVRVRSGGVCEMAIPGVCLGRATNYSHRVNASQGGAYAAGSALDACGSGVTGCHGYLHANPAKAYENGWLVKSWADPLAVRVLYRGQWALLDNEGSVAPSPDLGKAA